MEGGNCQKIAPQKELKDQKKFKTKLWKKKRKEKRRD
jgi:hypothetical protein